MQNKRFKFYLQIFIFITGAILLLAISLNTANKKNIHIIRQDALVYYTYLPATFIENDPFFLRKDEYDSLYRFWTKPTSIGRNVPKTTMGIALLEAPFFFGGDLYAKNTYHAEDGFSKPYQRAVALSSTFYAILGALFLFLFLKRRFSNWASFVSTLLITFGTNLYFYSVYEQGMSHPYTFFLLSALLLIISNWLSKKTILKSLLIGVLIGLIVLIRPINILFLLPIFIMFRETKENWKDYLLRLFKPISPLILIILGGVLSWLPQLIFWKIQAGTFLYFSYPGETFFWLKPHVFDGLFSFRKGWFIYTPLMAFALFGSLRLYKNHKNYFWALMIFLPPFLYITFSWWSWWYGGGFSARTLIDILPFMALPLTSLIEWTLEKKQRLYLLILPILFVALNIFQSWQYLNGVIHYDSMTWKSYKKSFLKTESTQEYYDLLQQPDYEKARLTGE